MTRTLSPANTARERSACPVTSQAPAVQPIAALVLAISSAPSGSPCALAVPARLGEPWPMVVRQTIRFGLPVSDLASAIARSLK